MTKLKIISFALLLVVVLIVVFQNTEPVETEFLFFSLTMPRAVLLLGTLLIGFVLGVLTTSRIVRSSAKPAPPAKRQ